MSIAQTVSSALRRLVPSLGLVALAVPAQAALGSPAPSSSFHGGTPALATELVAGGLSNPVVVAAPVGDPRVFVGERVTGRIRVVQDGVVLPTPFLDLGAEIEATFNEQGLLGLAFHPDYQENGYVFVYYTAPPWPGVSTLVRYRVSADDPNVADPNTRKVYLRIPQPFQGHNAGCLKFGLDGKLYISTGDGGFDDPFCLSLDEGSLLGRILRIDVDRPSPDPNPPADTGFQVELPGDARRLIRNEDTRPYSIPANNPYKGVPGASEETWHRGLRNPWHFCIDPLTGDMYIGDVGRNTIEEVDFAPAGVSDLDFGWKFMEGTLCFEDDPGLLDDCSASTPPCDHPSYTEPIFEYPHIDPEEGFRCAIIGGEVYRACEMPALHGTYFFGDFCTGRVWSFRYEGGSVVDFVERTAELDPPGALQLQNVVGFGLDGFHRICIVDSNGGEVYRIVPAGSSAPSTGPDCNGNGVLDSCDIAATPALDRNQNGILDDCERFPELHDRVPR